MPNINPGFFVVMALLIWLLVCNLPQRPEIELQGVFEPKVAQAVYPDPCSSDVIFCPQDDPLLAIKQATKEYGVSESLLIKLAECESQMGKMMIGDTFMPKPSVGLFQINLYFHPEVSFEQAMDFLFSARWTAKQIKAGRISLWSCADKI